jgi:hypothetical protein
VTPTKGSILVGDGSVYDEHPVGADLTVLIADSSQTLGVRWIAIPPGTMQTGYDNSGATQPKILVSAVNGPVVIQDAAVSIGDLIVYRNSTGTDFLNISSSALSYGQAGRRGVEIQDAPTGYPTFIYLPDGLTRTTQTGGAMLQWSSTVITNVPGGAPFGNDSAPAAINWQGETIFADLGFLFASQLLVNAAATITCQANVGPLYLFLDQFKTRADGGVRSCSQHNSLRLQPTWGPNLAGGSLTQTSAVYLLNNCSVDATVGSCSITTLRYWEGTDPTLVAGGAIGTFEAFRINNITTPTTIVGLVSAMSSGTFIQQTGTAISTFAGDVHVNNGVSLVFGTTGGNRVELLRSAAGVLRMIGVGGTFNEGLDWDFDPTPANTIDVQSSTGAGLGFNLPAFVIGTTAADPTSNWQFLLAPGAKTISVGGDFARALFSASANVTVNAAMAQLATWIINEPGATIGTGSVVNAANLIVQTSVAFGTNRYGLYVTSNPSGGTLNYCARFQGAAGVRVDGVFEHTGSTYGIFGTAPTTQPPAYSVTNVTTDRAYDANSTTLNELADVVGTLIADLQSWGGVG